MTPSEPHPSQDRHATVEIDTTARGARVVLSLPLEPRWTANRKKVLERARRALAAALEEEERTTEAGDGTTREKTASPGSPPGSGAWWLF